MVANADRRLLRFIGVISVCLLVSLLLGGCVERKLTINTQPAGAIVWLNDEEIGSSPVTVAFNWYGDYKVRISKDGYETLDTHKKLKAPLHDAFPFDFFAEVVWPGRIVDEYEWEFALEPYKAPKREDLIDSAEHLKEKAITKLRQDSPKSVE